MEKERLITKRAELIRIVEAIDGVIHSKDWQVLRGEFEGRIESLEKQLLAEARKAKLEDDKIYFLQGQIAEAKRYDLAPWQDKLKKELEGIKNNLQQ